MAAKRTQGVHRPWDSIPKAPNCGADAVPAAEGNTEASENGKTLRSAGVPDQGMCTTGFPRNLGRPRRLHRRIAVGGPLTKTQVRDDASLIPGSELGTLGWYR